jgi:uncharacterized protein (TIGR03000 family)
LDSCLGRSNMRSIIIITMFVSLLLPAETFGQRYRGYRDGGWYDGGGYYQGGYNPYWSFGRNGYWYPGGYSYAYPDSNYYSAPRTSNYYDPALPTYRDDSGLSANRARVEVIVPDSNAEIYIQDQKMSLTGTVRIFVSPDLEQNKTFTYTIMLKRNVAGRMVDETRKAEVKAGSRVIVDFTRPETAIMRQPGTGEQLPPPK